MSSSAEAFTAECANCQKPAAKICTGCKATPNQKAKIDSVAYCSAECQREAWPAHKDECKSRKARLAVFRICSTLQKIFHVFREKLFDRAIVRIEREGDKLFICEGPIPTPVTSCDYLQPFPYHLVENDEEKCAILSHLSCNDAVGWMHDLIEHTLAGVVAEVREHSVKAKATKRALMTIDKHGVKQVAEENMEHNILQIAMKDGFNYAFDPTCTQYGYFEPVVSWGEYRNTRVAEVTHDTGSGTNFGRVKRLLLTAGGNSQSITENVFWNSQMGSIKLKHAVEAWEEGEALKVRDMCKLLEKEFVAKQESLLAMVDWVLNDFLTDLRSLHEEKMAEIAAEKATSKAA